MDEKGKRLSLHQFPGDKPKPEIILKSVTTSHKNGISPSLHSKLPVSKGKDQLEAPLIKMQHEPKIATKSDQDSGKRLSGSFKVMDKIAQISNQKKLSLGIN